MRFYTTDRVGPKRTMTPEGFMVCHDVSIARVGEQVYASHELPGIAHVGGFITAVRDEEHVFDAQTIASFEGKPFVDNHPSGGRDVDATNWRQLSIGHIQNVRRGVGDRADTLVADIFVTCRDAIRAINEGKRELSAGYDMNVQQIAPGKIRMVDIKGNHVALVTEGRCGDRCSIGDKKMVLSLRDRVRRAFLGRDEAELNEVLNDLPEGGDKDADDKDTHVHIHMAGKGGPPAPDVNGDGDDADAAAAAAGGNPSVDGRLTALETGQAAILAELKKISGGDDAAADEGGGGEQQTDENSDLDGDADAEDDKPIRDAKVADAWTDVRSRAELLHPGIKLGVFDAKLAPKIVQDRLCAMRRRAVVAARDAGGELADAIAALSGGAKIQDMSCGAMGVLFVAASDKARDMNNAGAVSRTVARDGKAKAPAPPSNAELNKMHAEFWDKQKRGNRRAG